MRGTGKTSGEGAPGPCSCNPLEVGLGHGPGTKAEKEMRGSLRRVDVGFEDRVGREGWRATFPSRQWPEQQFLRPRQKCFEGWRTPCVARFPQRA